MFGRYETIYRRSITQQNSPLERQVTDSLSVVFKKTLRHGESDLVQRVFQYFISLSARGYSLDPEGSATESLLEHFEIAQRQILSEFAQAEDADSLAETTARVDGLLDTHTELWRIAVEHEDGQGLEYLHHMLDEPHQFRRYEYAPPPDIREQRDIPEDSIKALKQDHAASYRNAITNLRYATYGWAFKLYKEGDCSAGVINHIFSEYVEDDFGSVDKLSEHYFLMRDATEPMNSWERWNIERELNRNYGVATTGMAVHTWLLRFCCAALIWILDEQETIASLRDRDPADSPLTEYERIQNDVDRIMEQIESYRDRDGYPLDSLIDDEPSIEERCNSLLEYFEGVKSVLDEQEQAWIRTLPISDQIVSGYGDQVNSQLDSADFRTALETVGSIDQEETLDKDANATFSVEAKAPRRLFVDDGRQTVFQSPHRDLIERYRRLVLGKLNVRGQKVGSASDIPDALAKLIESEEVALLVCEHMEVGRILRDDERVKRSSNDVPGSHIDFMGIPVLRDVTNEFAAIALYEGEFYYVEENNGGPIKVDVTPGEDVDEWDSDENPDMDVRDYVKITYSYRAHIESSVSDGVIFRISS